MSQSKNKCRVISFRLSDLEYEAVAKQSHKLGYTSVSLFVRDAVLDPDRPELNRTVPDGEMNRLWKRLELLTSSLEEIYKRSPWKENY